MKFPARILALLSAFGLALALPTMGLGGQTLSASTATGTTEANITRIAAGILEQSQFAHHAIDNDLAGDFLDRYLDDLDWSRSLFLQSDLKDFAPYRATLAQATHGAGDTSAAHAIFGRFLQRLEQRVTYTTDLLRTAKFDFTGHDVYSYDREHAQRPRDLREAQALWRQQIRAEYLQEKLADKRPEQIVSTLTRRKTQQLATMKALHSDEVLEIYLNSLAHVFDPHSDYLGHEEMESLNIAMNLSLFGIGASLETEDGYCKIHELTPGGPALRSGLLKPGDRILAVAQSSGEPVDITNMSLTRTVELIRGPKGSTVNLAILPVGAPEGAPTKIVSLVRDEINLEDQRAKARILDLPTGQGGTVRLGVIDLPSFYADMGGRSGARSATADVATLLTKLKVEHVRGVVLDLRTNGGGSLEEAINLTGLFIRQGPVVQTRGFAGDIEVGSDKDPAVRYDGPLVLLTSRFSASASEILVGALQDYGRALVVGDSSTFGKGTVQSILPLALVMDRAGLSHTYDPGALKVTISKFYRPNGSSTQLRGVASDIVLPSPSDLSDVNESALKHPLPWDAVAPALHEELNRVQPYLGTLRERSLKRVKTEKEFSYLADDVARLKKSMDEKSVSLNEAERRQEMAQIKARNDEREQEDRAHPAARPTTYEITVKNASLPGLPQPLIATESKGKTKIAKPSSPGDELGRMATGRSPDSDVILNEATKILADYVDLLGGQHKRAKLAGSRESAPVL
jgi:carboxyl-terminal processing protease